MAPKSMNRRRFLKTSGVASAGALLAGCTQGSDGEGGSTPTEGGSTSPTESPGGDDPLNVGLITTSPADDLGFSQAIYQQINGLIEDPAESDFTTSDENQRLRNQLQLNDLAESVTFADYSSVLSDFSSGNDIVISHSNGYIESGGMQISQENPDTLYLTFHSAETPSDIPENHMLYNTQHFGALHMVNGYIAGLLTENDNVAIPSSLPILVTLAGIRGAISGINKSNPDASWNISWLEEVIFDPPQQQQNTQALIDQGADAVVNLANSTAPGETAQENNVWAVGAAMDQSEGAPDGFATSTVADQTPFFIEAFNAILDDSWESFWNKYPNHRPWIPNDYSPVYTLKYQDQENGFHPDVSDDVVEEAHSFVDSLNEFEDPDIQVPEVWSENVSPDGFEFTINTP